MSWLEQMPWVVPAAALVLGPSVAHLYKRVEQRDERTALIADAELCAKLPDCRERSIFALTLAVKADGYLRNSLLCKVQTHSLTRWQNGCLLGIYFIAAALCAWGAVFLVAVLAGNAFDLDWIPGHADFAVLIFAGVLYWYVARHWKNYFHRRNIRFEVNSRVNAKLSGLLHEMDSSPITPDPSDSATPLA